MDTKLDHADDGTQITWTLTDARKALLMMRHVRTKLIKAMVPNRVYLDGVKVVAHVALMRGKAMAAASALNATFTEGR